MPMRLVMAYGLILVLIAAAVFGIVRMRRKAAEDRAVRRGHRPKLPR